MEIKGVIQPLAGKGQPAAAVGAGVVHFGGAQAGAVAALFKQMRLARHPGPPQRTVHAHRVAQEEVARAGLHEGAREAEGEPADTTLVLRDYSGGYAGGSVATMVTTGGGFVIGGGT